jgi:hypothetical protein
VIEKESKRSFKKRGKSRKENECRITSKLEGWKLEADSRKHKR